MARDEGYQQLETLRHAWTERHGPIVQQRRSTRVVDQIDIYFTDGKKARLVISGDDSLWSIVTNPDARPPVGLTADQLPGHVRHALEPSS